MEGNLRLWLSLNSALENKGTHYLLFLKLQPQIVVDHTGRHLTRGHGQLDLVFAGFQYRGLELDIAFLPKPFFRVVAQRVGARRRHTPNVLPIDGYGQSTLPVGTGQSDAESRLAL